MEFTDWLQWYHYINLHLTGLSIIHLQFIDNFGDTSNVNLHPDEVKEVER